MLTHVLKYWVRSGSLQFALDLSTSLPAQESKSFRWRGHRLHYRPGTSDMEILCKILFKPEAKQEYQRPPISSPKVILDIGANIGAASIWLAKMYPEAHVYSFEPMPENFRLLEKNAQGWPNIHPLNFALGREDGEQELFGSDDPKNFGGCSLYSEGIDRQNRIKVRVRNAQAALSELKLEKVDLIKIDTEGAEYDVMTSIAPAILREVGWIMGELHGNRDFELLTHLSRFFDITVRKDMDNRLGMFSARKRCE